MSEHDHALRRAKVDNRRLGIVLAVDTWYTKQDGYCVAKVIHVDVYAVHLEIERPNGTTKQWVSKGHIVSTGDPEDDK